MKKLSLLFLSIFMVLLCNAQQEISFKLNKDGKFLTESGDDFIVIPFEGKSAQEIYMQLIENINKLYKNPKEVLSTIENTSISVFAMGCDIAYDKILGITRSGCGTYTIKISIKDNRIRYELPIIDKVTFGSGEHSMTVSYAYQIGTYFDKKGEVKSKRVEWVKAIENKMIKICNLIINGRKDQKEENDW